MNCRLRWAGAPCVVQGGTAHLPATRGTRMSGFGARGEDQLIRKLLSAAGAAAVVMALTVSAPAQEIKLTLADQNSPTGWGPAHALYPWVKQVEEATKGRVKIEVFPSQTLIKGVDMWKGVRSGIADRKSVV